jgi:hypothetical protein
MYNGANDTKIAPIFVHLATTEQIKQSN